MCSQLMDDMMMMNVEVNCCVRRGDRDRGTWRWMYPRCRVVQDHYVISDAVDDAVIPLPAEATCIRGKYVVERGGEQ